MIESCAEKNCHDKVVFVKYSRDFKLFSGIINTMLNIIFQVMCYMDKGINIIHKNEKLSFGVKLQSRELNLVLRKTAMIVREVPTRSIP